MLTDARSIRRNGVSGMANEVAEVGATGRSILATVLLAVLVFAAGAFAGFAGRLLWPRSR